MAREGALVHAARHGDCREPGPRRTITAPSPPGIAKPAPGCYGRRVVHQWSFLVRSFAMLARPCAVLAMLAQLLFPLVALAAMAPPTGAGGTICGAAAEANVARPSDDRAPTAHHCLTCPVCQLRVQTTIPPMAEPAGLVIPPTAFPLVFGHPERIAQPRAPPLFRAHARSPPVLS